MSNEITVDPMLPVNPQFQEAFRQAITINVGLIGTLKDSGFGGSHKSTREAVNRAIDHAKGNRPPSATPNVHDLKYYLAAALRAMADELET